MDNFTISNLNSLLEKTSDRIKGISKLLNSADNTIDQEKYFALIQYLEKRKKELEIAYKRLTKLKNLQKEIEEANLEYIATVTKQRKESLIEEEIREQQKALQGKEEINSYIDELHKIIEITETIREVHKTSKEISSFIKLEQQEIENNKQTISSLKEELEASHPEIAKLCGQALTSLSNIQKDYQEINEYMQDILVDDAEDSELMKSLKTSKKHIITKIIDSEKTQQQKQGNSNSKESAIDLLLERSAEQEHMDTVLLNNLKKLKEEFNLTADEIEDLKKEISDKNQSLIIEPETKEDVASCKLGVNYVEIAKCLKELNALQQKLNQISQERKELMKLLELARNNKDFTTISNCLVNIQTLEIESQKLKREANDIHKNYQTIKKEIISINSSKHKKQFLTGFDGYKEKHKTSSKDPGPDGTNNTAKEPTDSKKFKN